MIRGGNSLLKRRRSAFGELVQGDSHVVDFEMAVGLRGEPRISMTHDALNDRVRNLALSNRVAVE